MPTDQVGVQDCVIKTKNKLANYSYDYFKSSYASTKGDCVEYKKIGLN